jgi:hypothetical protein
MSQWKLMKARRVFTALLGIGCSIKRQSCPHRSLECEGWPNYEFALHGIYAHSGDSLVGCGLLSQIPLIISSTTPRLSRTHEANLLLEASCGATLR